ncbi:family 16 glycosylhydrolase [Nocardia sp. NPDC059195]|uniref:glycoside hydrolase family 16 protein n=1 Tax=Nocardia sp. NPDC059195 TaxID=3346765 RepID=UPI003689EF5D
MTVRHHRASSRVGIVVAVALLGAGCGQASTTVDQTRPAFADEFDGPPGAAPDPSIWRPDVGGTGWGNEELQYYTRGVNTALDGRGNLVIEAREGSDGHSCWYGRCRYTSGKLTTRQRRGVAFAQSYGTFEARIRMPSGAGLWPAFWLLGENIDAVGHPAAGEIDIVETLGARTDSVEQHVHGPGLDFGAEFRLPAGQSVTDWHTYAVEWAPDRITWLVDGQATRTLTRAEAGPGWVFDHRFYLLLNLAVGGEWPGSPDRDTVFPARMLIDYVRVYPGERY